MPSSLTSQLIRRVVYIWQASSCPPGLATSASPKILLGLASLYQVLGAVVRDSSGGFALLLEFTLRGTTASVRIEELDTHNMCYEPLVWGAPVSQVTIRVRSVTHIIFYVWPNARRRSNHICWLTRDRERRRSNNAELNRVDRFDLLIIDDCRWYL